MLTGWREQEAEWALNAGTIVLNKHIMNEWLISQVVSSRDAIYIAPSGVQKERIKSDELFIQDMEGRDLKLPPISKNLKKSQCTPLFMCAYKGRKPIQIRVYLNLITYD